MMDDAPNWVVRPIVTWPGKATPRYAQRRAPFRSTWSQTTRLLAREVKAITVYPYRVVLEAFVTERDLRQDGWVRSQVTPSQPGVIVSLTHCDGTALRFPCDAFDDWQDNVRAIALGLEALRAVDRYGITKRAEQYGGWKALPASTTNTLTEKQARLIINDYGGDGPIAEALQRARNRTHPDRPLGSVEAFQRVEQARKVLGL